MTQTDFRARPGDPVVLNLPCGRGHRTPLNPRAMKREILRTGAESFRYTHRCGCGDTGTFGASLAEYVLRIA